MSCPFSPFPDEIYQAPRSWAERAYPKLIYYNKLDKGGHFAAWEQPQLFSEEVRAELQTAAQIVARAARSGFSTPSARVRTSSGSPAVLVADCSLLNLR